MAKWTLSYFPQTYPVVTGTAEQHRFPVEYRSMRGELTHSLQNTGLGMGEGLSCLFSTTHAFI